MTSEFQDQDRDGENRKVNRVALARPSLAGLDLSTSVPPNRPRRKSLIQLQKLTLGQSIVDSEQNKLCRLSPRLTAYKNLFGLSWSWLTVFGAFLGIQALQSSINQEANLGLTSLCVLNGFFALSTLITPTIIRLIGTKYALIGGYVVFFLYTLSNVYPHWYTLIPSSFLLGVAQGPAWASLNTHATNVAIKYAPDFKQKTKHLIINFSGVISFHIQIAQALGTLVSSLVLIQCDTGSNSTSNSTSMAMNLSTTADVNGTCDDSEFCTDTSALNLSNVCLYILIGVYGLMDIIGIVIACVMLDGVSTDTQFLSFSKKCTVYIKEPLVEIFQVFCSWKMLLLVAPTLFNGMELAFIAGRFGQVYVSECVGVRWVGFAGMVFGLASATSAISGGLVVKWIPEHFLMYLGYINNISLVLFLLFWERMPNYIVVFLFPIVWALSDGVWNAFIPGIVGVQFTNRLEAGFSVMRTFLATGFLIGFFTARSEICTTYQLWGYFAMIILALSSYTLLSLLTKKKHELLPCCIKKTQTEEDKEMTEKDKQPTKAEENGTNEVQTQL